MSSKRIMVNKKSLSEWINFFHSNYPFTKELEIDDKLYIDFAIKLAMGKKFDIIKKRKRLVIENETYA